MSVRQVGLLLELLQSLFSLKTLTHVMSGDADRRHIDRQRASLLIKPQWLIASGTCCDSLFYSVTKISHRNNLWEERLTVSLGFQSIVMGESRRHSGHNRCLCGTRGKAYSLQQAWAPKVSKNSPKHHSWVSWPMFLIPVGESLWVSSQPGLHGQTLSLKQNKIRKQTNKVLGWR